MNCVKCWMRVVECRYMVCNCVQTFNNMPLANICGKTSADNIDRQYADILQHASKT